MDTTTNQSVFTDAKPNRQQRRKALNLNHRNHVRQFIPSSSFWDGNIGKWVETPAKVIFHLKKSNLPRLYPNMSRIKNRKILNHDNHNPFRLPTPRTY